jgi:hypothetical protein
METDKVMHILSEKATARDSTYSDMLSQPLAEMQVILYPIFRHIE